MKQVKAVTNVYELRDIAEECDNGAQLQRRKIGKDQWEAVPDPRDDYSFYPFDLGTYEYQYSHVLALEVDGGACTIHQEGDFWEYPTQNIRRLIEVWAQRRAKKQILNGDNTFIITDEEGAITAEEANRSYDYTILPAKVEELKIGCQTFKWEEVKAEAIKLGWLNKKGMPVSKTLAKKTRK